ncbi:MAG TPA: plastocyanin/azurin family copper-binding protein [Rudaea sp.]|nr:plastocyanin/azurin family copper-binding protein [Rudaea sp.]
MHRWLTLCLLLALAPAARATSYFVNVGGNQLAFSPQTVVIDVGDTVTFVNKGGFHNVRADNGSFRCARGCDGVGNGSGNPSNSNWLATVTFSHPGTIGYFCETHGKPGDGMYGTVVVQGAPRADTPGAVPAASPGLLALLAGALALSALVARALRRGRS